MRRHRIPRRELFLDVPAPAMSSALAAADTRPRGREGVCDAVAREARADSTRAAPPPAVAPLPLVVSRSVGRVEAAAGVGLTDDASLRRADEDTLEEARAEAEADADEHDDHDHDDDEASAVTAEARLGATGATAATGRRYAAVEVLAVEFDADGVARDIPLRYVHGVGRVPAANMPFRETELDWMTKCETSPPGTVWRICTKRAMPEISAARTPISPCRAVLCGEHVAFVEDDPLYVLRGAERRQDDPAGRELLRRRAGAAVRSRRRRRRASLLGAPG